MAAPEGAEQHAVWKKNAPYLYDAIMTKELAWPTLTLEWLPESRLDADKECRVHRLLMGTCTDGGEPNHLIVAEVLLPPQPEQLDMKRFDPTTEEVGGYNRSDARIAIKQEAGLDGKTYDRARVVLVHDSEVLCARACPHNPNVIATKPGQSGDTLVFDLRLHFWDLKGQGAECHPNLRLKPPRPATEGPALAWSPLRAGLMATSPSDGVVDVWDVTAMTPADMPCPTTELCGHQGLVEEVAFHPHDEHALGSVGDDGAAYVWDLRFSRPALRIAAHMTEANSLSFTPWNPLVLATGSSDAAVKIWDLRRVADAAVTLRFHTAPVYQVRFAPFWEPILATAGLDGRVLLWDLSKAGEPQAADGLPPALLYIHAGHHAPVTDVGWHPTEDWLLASASEDNLLHVWRMAADLYEQN